jgi:hypothetical protein
MLRRHARQSAALALVVCFLAVAPVVAQERTIETALFRLELPKGWKTDGQSTPRRVRGPNSEVMLITIAMPDPAGVNANWMAETKEVERFWREGIRRSLVTGVAQKKGMKQTEPFTERTLKGLPCYTAKSQDDQRGIFLSGYGLIGRRGVVVLITVEGSLKDRPTGEAAAERVLKNIVWKRQN